MFTFISKDAICIENIFTNSDFTKRKTMSGLYKDLLHKIECLKWDLPIVKDTCWNTNICYLSP